MGVNEWHGAIGSVTEVTHCCSSNTARTNARMVAMVLMPVENQQVY